MTQTNGGVLSSCERYRYSLAREWDRGTPPLTFVMLNPSTADATLDDPTIGRCIGFAKDRGYGAVRVLNLFAFRATDPGEMMAAPDPVGPDNDQHIREAFVSAAEAGAPVIAAWGVNGVHGGRDATVRALATECGVTLMCLGTTKDGHPRHPLYVPAAQEFVTLS
jgi:hypothetical protein